MLKRIIFLQMFAEGGEGATGGEGEGTSGESIPSSIPERARKLYAETVGKSKAKTEATPKEATPKEVSVEAPHDLTYAELIKSDKYKAEHQAYMENTINNRLKKYKGVEEENSKMKASLATVAQKYGIDSTSETFLEELSKAVEEDDSYYEKYAMDHDISPTEARKIVTLERKVAENERLRQEQAAEENRRNQIQTLQNNAQKTAALYPGFNLEVELQNPDFVRLAAATNGDTTAAYIATHHNEIIGNAVHQAVEQTKAQTAQTVAYKGNRPQENGLTGQASSKVNVNFSNMSLAELRAYAEEQRRRGR